MSEVGRKRMAERGVGPFFGSRFVLGAMGTRISTDGTKLSRAVSVPSVSFRVICVSGDRAGVGRPPVGD